MIDLRHAVKIFMFVIIIVIMIEEVLVVVRVRLMTLGILIIMRVKKYGHSFQPVLLLECGVVWLH